MSNFAWDNGFNEALDRVITAIDNAYDEADREGDDEYINEHIVGWEFVKNAIKEIREQYNKGE